MPRCHWASPFSINLSHPLLSLSLLLSPQLRWGSVVRVRVMVGPPSGGLFISLGPPSSGLFDWRLRVHPDSRQSTLLEVSRPQGHRLRVHPDSRCWGLRRLLDSGYGSALIPAVHWLMLEV